MRLQQKKQVRNRMIIIQFDYGYYGWGELLLGSLALHEPEQRVLIDAINLDPEQLDRLRRLHPQVICQNELLPEPPCREEMATRKPTVMQRAMRMYPDEAAYALFDADLLVRRRLPDLWQRLDGFPMALMVTDGVWRGRIYPRLITVSSLVLVRRDGRELIDNWARWIEHDRPLDSIRPRAWMWDQVTLFFAWCETRLDFGSIPIESFADASLSPRSAIWSANVTNKQHYQALFHHELDRQRHDTEYSHD